MLFISHIQEYLTSKETLWKTNTKRQYWNAYKNHLEPFFKGIPLEELTRKKLQEFIDTGDTQRPQAIAILKSVLKELYMDDMIPKDWSGMLKKNKRIHPKKRPKKVLTKDQLDRFFEALKGNRRELLVRLLFATGMRVGEALALQWSDISFIEDSTVAVIDITKTLNEHNGVLEDPKTHTSIRKVFLVEPYTIELLKEYPRTSEWLFLSTHRDKPIHRRTLEDLLKRISIKANLPVIISTHYGRMHYISYSLSKGIDLKNIQEQVGHSNVNLILNTYGKAIGNRKEQLMEYRELYN